MHWIDFLSYFFGGVFLTNAVPHSVSALMGRPFQTPFAKPPGQGLSSSSVNALWGFLNLAIAYGLLCHVGDFNLKSVADAAALGFGVLLMSLVSAQMFGRYNGGNSIEGA